MCVHAHISFTFIKGLYKECMVNFIYFPINYNIIHFCAFFLVSLFVYHLTENCPYIFVMSVLAPCICCILLLNK